jgi:hypothetical protein
MEKKHFLFYFGVVSRRLPKLVNNWNFKRLANMIIDDDWIKFCVTIYPLLRNHSGLDYRNFLYRERKRKILFERKLAVEEKNIEKERGGSYIKSIKRRFCAMQEALLQHIHIVECSGGLPPDGSSKGGTEKRSREEESINSSPEGAPKKARSRPSKKRKEMHNDDSDNPPPPPPPPPPVAASGPAIKSVKCGLRAVVKSSKFYHLSPDLIVRTIREVGAKHHEALYFGKMLMRFTCWRTRW